MMIAKVAPKRKILLFFAIEPSMEVIRDFCVSLIFISFSKEKILNKEGKKESN